MYKWLIFILITLLAGSASADTAKLPQEATYHIFIHGLHSGVDKIKIEETDGAIVSTSVISLSYENYVLEMTSKTTVDAETYHLREFEYEGIKEGKAISGKMLVTGKTISGVFTADGEEFSWTKELDADGIFSIEDYHFDHYMILSKAYAGTNEYMMKTHVIHPTITATLPAQLFTESERSIPVGEKDIICKKILISFRSNPSVFAFVDPKTDLPIFLGFPSSKTEAHLESYFGENPTPFYQRLDSETPSE